MAHQQQDWKNVLHAEKSKRRRQDDLDNQREKKVKSRIMYKRRKIQKEINQLLKQKDGIKYEQIVRLHGKFGVRCF